MNPLCNSLAPPLKSWMLSTRQAATRNGSSRQGPHLIISSVSGQPLTTTVQVSTSTQSWVGFTFMLGAV